jgi:hypothetical protein
MIDALLISAAIVNLAYCIWAFDQGRKLPEMVGNAIAFLAMLTILAGHHAIAF